jgi:hypothetical protein
MARQIALLVTALMLALLVLLVSAASTLAQGGLGQAAPTEPGEPECINCHRFVSADVVETWRDQAHGRNEVGCPACHNSHQEDFMPNPTVAVCSECHQVREVHPEYQDSVPAERCMDCHQGNIHWYPGEGSWFVSGLPPERLEQATTRPENSISPSQARAAGIVVVGLAAIMGLAVGYLLNRLIKQL